MTTTDIILNAPDDAQVTIAYPIGHDASGSDTISIGELKKMAERERKMSQPFMPSDDIMDRELRRLKNAQ